MPKDPRIKKVLVIGSGPIIIGQAAEFDYSGTQACRALKAEGIETVLLNSNPATIMTDPDVADHVYIEPMTLEVVERILDIEKPDSVLPNLGGQMGLNLSMELARSGYLDRTGIRLLACKPETIDRAEDRELFKETMEKLHQPIIPSEVVETLQDALACADRIGYPVIVRPAFTMGGTGGGICETREKLIEIGTNGLRLSPIHQILVEKCIAGWKEIEYEVMRDHKGNVITVCNMENLDPVGIHTGDSVVVAPSQTLTDHEYQMLRTAALDIITELGIEGGCNCQFALKPDSYDYAVIEVNPRVSRSSALASKATGYPIAKVATKIAIGYTLDEITNDVTGKTCACFEPALDYIVVKYPKWPFDKFVYADKSLGTQMMATGEVMSIGNSFEAAMMKAVSSIELGMDTLTHKPFEELTDDEIVAHMHVQDAERVFCVYEALKRGIDHETIYKITKIDWWFLDKMQHLADLEKGLAKCNGVLTEEQYKTAKKYGFQDKTIKRLAQVELTRSGDGIFSGQAAVPADSTSLQILVTVRTGGDTATERLYEGRATGLLPMALSSRSGEAALQEGEARITAAVRLREKAAAASEQTFRLYRDGQLEETIPAASGQESGTWGGTGTVSCAAGDQLEVRFFCVDGLGLGYEFPVRTWTVKEDRLAPGWPVTNTPVLVWP